MLHSVQDVDYTDSLRTSWKNGREIESDLSQECNQIQHYDGTRHFRISLLQQLDS